MRSNGRQAVSPEVVILCGGRGTRLGATTDVTPKPLVEVGGRPILWHIMSHYAGYGFKRFVLCLGYKGEAIREYFLNYQLHHNDFTIRFAQDGPRVTPELNDVLDWEVTCADTGLSAMTGARIRRIQRYITGPYFLCTYGDGVSDISLTELIRFHLEHGKVATVAGVHPPARFGELVLGDETRVARFSEKPMLNPRLGGGYVNGGFFVFNRTLFDYLPDDDQCVLEREPLERLAAEGELQIFKHDGFWRCMDTPKDRDEMDALLLERAARVGQGAAPSAPPAGRDAVSRDILASGR